MKKFYEFCKPWFLRTVYYLALVFIIWTCCDTNYTVIISNNFSFTDDGQKITWLLSSLASITAIFLIITNRKNL